jgi:hypothetical protein
VATALHPRLIPLQPSQIFEVRNRRQDRSDCPDNDQAFTEVHCGLVHPDRLRRLCFVTKGANEGHHAEPEAVHCEGRSDPGQHDAIERLCYTKVGRAPFGAGQAGLGDRRVPRAGMGGTVLISGAFFWT